MFTFLVKVSGGCKIDVCKLLQIGKNGLDFYIASRISEIITKGYNDTIAIVSCDKGFSAVQDYWKCRGSKHAEIVLCKDIASGIILSCEGSKRCKRAVKDSKRISIGYAFNQYKKDYELKEKLEKLYRRTSYLKETNEIQKILECHTKKKIIYVEIIKHFGQKDGLKIYRVLKENYF